MKRFFLFSAVLLAAACRAGAQQPDAAQVVVHYKFVHLRDTNNPTHHFTQDMILQAGKCASVYKPKPTRNSDNTAPALPRPKFGTEYYLFLAEKKLIRIEGLFNAYLIDETMPAIDWRFTRDTATRGGLKCRKATTHFKGRDYTAWFCPDLPLHAGPWKLCGLPGLIVEAYDAKKEVQFLFAGLEKATDADLISLPKDAIQTTDTEFERFKELSQKNPEAFSKALTMQNGGIPGKSGPQIDIRPAPAPVINNPIELPEKK